MGDWAPTQTLQVTSNEGTHTLYLWVVPGKPSEPDDPLTLPSPPWKGRGRRG